MNLMQYIGMGILMLLDLNEPLVSKVTSLASVIQNGYLFSE